MTYNTTRAEPTGSQLSALQCYAGRNGRTWKSKLLHAWETGADSRELDGPLLREVRNQFGPTWLLKFKVSA